MNLLLRLAICTLLPIAALATLGVQLMLAAVRMVTPNGMECIIFDSDDDRLDDIDRSDCIAVPCGPADMVIKRDGRRYEYMKIEAIKQTSICVDSDDPQSDCTMWGEPDFDDLVCSKKLYYTNQLDGQCAGFQIVRYAAYPQCHVNPTLQVPVGPMSKID